MQAGLHTQQAIAITSQQVNLHSSQTIVPLKVSLQGPAQLWQSTQVLPAPVACEAFMAYQAPQHLQYQMASLQQQILPRNPPQQQVIRPEPQSGFTDHQDRLASRPAAHYHASLTHPAKSSASCCCSWHCCRVRAGRDCYRRDLDTRAANPPSLCTQWATSKYNR